jgi:GNAT superfamily N-acetyltransferase
VGGLVDRVRTGLRNRGPAGLARTVARKVRGAVHLDTDHRWYELDLTGERDRLELPAGVRVRPGTEADLEFAASMSSQVGETTVRRRHASGEQLWIAERDGEPVGFFWVFATTTPSVAAPGAALPLPDGTVAIDDTFTSPAHRGRGVAPASWAVAAEALAREGRRSIVMSIEAGNAASRRAAEKAGFREVAAVRLKRRLRRTRVSVSGAGGFGAHLKGLER